MKLFNNKNLITYIIVFTILLLSIGYSSFSSNLSIRDLYAEVRLEKDVRITGVTVAPETEQSSNILPLGTEYQIDPGDGVTRTFYVLEDGDNTSLIKGDTGTTGVGEVSLIMNENIGARTEWGIAGSGAPTISLPYLKEQTTGWSNVEVNMPTYEQIYSVNNSTDLTATPWLNSNSYDEYGNETCYWTAKFSVSEPVGDIGYSVRQETFSAGSSYCFVRPVITLKKSDLLGTVVIQNNGGTTTYLDYNVKNIQTGINLPNANSSVTFNVVVTNLGSAEVGIKSITGLPDNLDYEILNYNLKDKICDENNICKLGIQKEIQIKIKYKEGYYDSNNTQYNIVANFDFQPFYTINYIDIDGEGYPTEILGGDTLTVDFGDNAPENIKIKINNVETNNYTYENGILTLAAVSGNVEIKNAKVCILLNGKSNEIGSKYSCEVKEGINYNFYVLSKEDNGSTNLIMDQNINSDGSPAGMIGVKQSTNPTKYNLVAWQSSGYTADGPVTVMQFLHNATKDWENIPALNYTYNNRESQSIPTDAPPKGYISFVSDDGVATITSLSGDETVIGDPKEPLKARIPIYSNDTSITEVTRELNASYLYDNLDPNGSNPPYGYWTLSTYYSYDAWFVFADGSLLTASTETNIDFGARPVINLKL